MPKGSLPRSRSGRIMDYLVNRSNIGKPVRSWKKLMDNPPSLTGPIRDEDVERVFDVGSAVAGGSTAFARPKGSLGTGARPFKVEGAQPARPAAPSKPATPKKTSASGPKKTSASGPKSRQQPSGTFTSRVDAMRKRPRTQRESEVFGPVAIRRTTEPTKYQRPGGAVTKYERPGGAVARPQASNAADKRDLMTVRGGGSDKGRIVGISPTGKMILGGAAAGAAGYAAYKARAGKTAAETAEGKGDKGVVNRREGGGGMTASAKTDRGGSKAQSFKGKMQGRNWKGGAKPAPKVERKAEGRKPEKRKIGFKGNWVGAAPTAMQARGGVRRTKAENLRRLFRER